VASYEVKKGLTGYKVLYGCPSCGVALSSPIAKAGVTEACPDCGHKHAIPGAKEKQELDNAAAALELQKLEERLRKQSEDARRKAAAAKREAEAAANLPVTVPKQATTRATSNNPTNYRFGDSILDFAFACTRGFSIVVIVVSLFALSLIGILFATAYGNYKSSVEPVAVLPSDADFKRYLELKQDDENAGVDVQPIATSSTENPTLKVLSKHGLTTNSNGT